MYVTGGGPGQMYYVLKLRMAGEVLVNLWFRRSSLRATTKQMLLLIAATRVATRAPAK